MKYKHCEISDNYKIKYHKNPISGYIWSEHIPVPGYKVYGGKLMLRKFRNLERAKKAIDFDYKFFYNKD